MNQFFVFRYKKNVIIDEDETYVRVDRNFSDSNYVCTISDKNMFGALQYPYVEFIINKKQLEDKELNESDMINKMPWMMPFEGKKIVIDDEILIDGEELFDLISKLNPISNQILISFKNVKAITYECVEKCFRKLYGMLNHLYHTNIILTDMSDDVKKQYDMIMKMPSLD